MSILHGILTKFKRSHATEPPFIVQQIGAGFIQQWTQGEATINGTEKARIENDGKFVTTGGITIDGSPDVIIKTNGQIVGYPRTIDVNTGSTGNVGGGLDSLYSFSLPAGSLATNGDWVRWEATGVFASNDNNKRIVTSFGGQGIEDIGLVDIDQGAWVSRVTIIRVSDTTVRCSSVVGQFFIGVSNAGGATPALLASSNGYYVVREPLLTVSDLDTNAATILVQAEGTSNDDIVQNFSLIELCQTA